MQLYLAVVGRMKKGPEQELVARYGDRLTRSGKTVGLTSFKIVEIVESRASDSATRKRDEADNLLARLPDGCVLYALDETGKSPTSRLFAGDIGELLDAGTNALALVIGGPDGLDQQIREKAEKVVSFGALTIPHQLVRILALEQIYRATTILTNHPYHRE